MARFEIRYGRARPLTSEEMSRTLPSLVLLLLMGKAQVIFPGSDTPSPALNVLVRPMLNRHDQGWFSDRGLSVTGTFTMRWDQWNLVMVPFIRSIQDPDGEYAFLNITVPLNRQALCHVGDARRLRDELARAIEDAFEQAGYGSPS